jgi:hypothetical protein
MSESESESESVSHSGSEDSSSSLPVKVATKSAAKAKLKDVAVVKGKGGRKGGSKSAAAVLAKGKSQAQSSANRRTPPAKKSKPGSSAKRSTPPAKKSKPVSNAKSRTQPTTKSKPVSNAKSRIPPANKSKPVTSASTLTLANDKTTMASRKKRTVPKSPTEATDEDDTYSSPKSKSKKQRNSSHVSQGIMEYTDTQDIPTTPVSESSQKMFLKFAFGVNVDNLPSIATEVSNLPTSSECHPTIVSANVADFPVDAMNTANIGDVPVNATSTTTVPVIPVDATSSLKAADNSATTNVADVPADATITLKAADNSATTNVADVPADVTITLKANDNSATTNVADGPVDAMSTLKDANNSALSNAANKKINDSNCDVNRALNAESEGHNVTGKASSTSELITASDETKFTSDTSDVPSSSKKQIDGNLPTRTVTSYLDLVDISKQSCCGYSYVLRLVDPIARLGHVMILKSTSDDALCEAFSKLMCIARFPPTTIYYDEKFTFIPTVASLYPRVVFTKQPYSDLMKKERSLFRRQLRKWIFSYGNNWLRGVTVVQAVTNTLSLENVDLTD